MATKKTTTKFEVKFQNGSSTIVAKSSKGENEFPVAVYTIHDMDRISETREKLIASKKIEATE